MAAAPGPFTHGVASFDPLADAVLLWTRLRPGCRAVRWHVSTDVDAREVVREGTTSVPRGGDGCVTVDVDGLQPATTYHYWFSCDGVLSPLGRTRTLPAGPTDQARLAVLCCSDLSMGPLRAFRAVAEDEVDLVLHLGDYLYEEPKGDRRVEPAGTCSTLEDYRGRHAATRSSPDVQALHLRHPMVFTWDDHDVADNAWRHGAKAHDPEEHGPWEDRLRAAARARDEWLPCRSQDPADPLAMWRAFRLGDLADVVVLDTRIPGRDEQAGDGEQAKDLHDPDRSLLGAEQRDWAHERIRSARSTWSLVASQVTVSPLSLPVPAGSAVDAALPGGYGTVGDEVVCTDEWDGYPAERAALLDAIVARGGGTVLVSGDVHSSWAFEPRHGDDEPVAVEAVCPGTSATPMARQLPAGWEAVADVAAEGVADHRWRDLEHNGYLRLEVRPGAVRADWMAAEPADGDDDRPRLLASWVTDRDGPPRWRPATPGVAVAAGPADLGRDGVDLAVLPAPERAPDATRRRWPVVLAGLAVLAGAAVGGLLWWRRRRG